MQHACQAKQDKGGEPDMSTDAASQYETTRPQTASAPALDDHQEQAARLDRDNPQWLVVWGIFSHQFVAFPLFRAPEGIVLCCQSGPELVRRMRQTEEIYGRSRDVGQ
jgi:hypothetical protein